MKRRVFVRRHLRRGRPVRAHFASYAEERYEVGVPRTKPYVVLKDFGSHHVGETLSLFVNVDADRLVREGKVKRVEDI